MLARVLIFGDNLCVDLFPTRSMRREKVLNIFKIDISYEFEIFTRGTP